MDRLNETEDTEGQQDIGTEPEVEKKEEAELMFKDGEVEIPVSKIREWRETYENDTKWRASNTQKAMELADRERKLEKSLLIENWVSENPDKFSQVEAIFKAQKENGGQISPEIQKQLEEMNSLKDRLEERDAMNRLKEDLADVKEKYGEYFKEIPDLEKKILKHASENNIMNLRLATRDYIFDKGQEIWLKKGQQKLSDAKKNSLGMGMPKGSKGMPVDMKKEILGKKKMGDAISAYLEATEGA